MTFATEADLCRAFIEALPEGWTAYPETAGFDLVLVRVEDGFQIGIEAKLRLNAKVICQAAERRSHRAVCAEGPDCRAVLVPYGKHRTDFATLLDLLHIVPLTFRTHEGFRSPIVQFYPPLPDPQANYSRHEWPEFCPETRIKLPDYVPDVQSGASAPVRLTQWKVKAIKIAILLERRGFVTRADFKHFQISMSMWTQSGWIVQDSARGSWIAGRVPDFRRQHPVNYAEIAADFDDWAPPDQGREIQGALALRAAE